MPTTTMRTVHLLLAVAPAAIALHALDARADPLPGQGLVFQQQPMVVTGVGDKTYFGRDEISTVTEDLNIPGNFTGSYMADDFALRAPGSIVHLRWWGSYIDDKVNAGVRQFLVSFESDAPAMLPNNPFSHPDRPLLSQIIDRGVIGPRSGTFTEEKIRFADPVAGESLYQYNAELRLPFQVGADTVYWLKIVALAAPADTWLWGWHNRNYTVQNAFAPVFPGVDPGERDEGPLATGEAVWHFQDNAVFGLMDLTLAPTGLMVDQQTPLPAFYPSPEDGPAQIGNFSMDLSFEVFVAPAPGTLLLLLAGAAGCAWSSRLRPAPGGSGARSRAVTA